MPSLGNISPHTTLEMSTPLSENQERMSPNRLCSVILEVYDGVCVVRVRQTIMRPI